jgi:periplasmic copper chaperone A
MRALVCIAVLGLMASPAVSADFAAKGLKIGHPWTRPAALGGTGAGYMTVTNSGKAADTLVGIETAAARSAGVHRSAMNGQVMSMRPLPALAIAAGQTVSLKPGGDHIMMVGLTRALSQGEQIPITLVFQKAGRIHIALTVETTGPAPAAPDHNNH